MNTSDPINPATLPSILPPPAIDAPAVEATENKTAETKVAEAKTVEAPPVKRPAAEEAKQELSKAHFVHGNSIATADPQTAASSIKKKKPGTSGKAKDLPDDNLYIELTGAMSESFRLVQAGYAARGLGILPLHQTIEELWAKHGADFSESFCRMRIDGSDAKFIAFMRLEKEMREKCGEYVGDPDSDRIKLRLSKMTAGKLTEWSRTISIRWGAKYQRRTILEMLWNSYGLDRYKAVLNRNALI